MDVRAAAILLLALQASASARQTTPTVVAFEREAAVAERFLDLGCVLYDRRARGWDCADQVATALHDRSFPIADLERLTKHRDPRVRTLALVHLYQRADPSLLPTIVTLVDDMGPTFPAHTPVALMPFPGPAALRDIPQTAQTVGAVAEAMVRFYLERAGYSYGSHGSATCPGFSHYWAERRSRGHVASWFAVQLDRATQGTAPIPQGRERAFAAVRARVDPLAGEDRLWYTLFVGAMEGGDRVFSEAELLAAGQALGPERLMLMLANRAPASDPDLVPPPWPAACGRSDVGEAMRRFVLDHAPALLRRDDAVTLLEAPDAPYAHWAIAAAALRPDRAEGVLKNAITNLDGIVFGWDQAKMAAALVRIAGAPHTAYALDWFYGRPPNDTRTTAQEIFIAEVVRRSGAGGRALLGQLVSDARFDAIPEPALQALVDHINGWLPSPVVESPFAYVSEADKPATLARWRRAVRDSVRRWQ